VVEVDQAEIPFRADNSFFDPAKSGKILIAGVVEVIDRGTNQPAVDGPTTSKPTLIGYARVSTIDQNLALQRDA
jgi:hypothetical protein